MNDLTKIAMIDDHILLRDALGDTINSFEDCQVILLAQHGREFIEKLDKENLPDLVIMDVNMPVMDGYETAAWLQSNYPDLRVLVLTMYDSEMALIRLIQLGVRGFLKKDIHPEELKNGIQQMMRNGYYYSDASGKMLNLFRKEDNPYGRLQTVFLSANEMTFLKLAATDLTYKEIAHQMDVSPRTVDNYRDALFLKLNIKSRVGLVLYAIKNAVISPGY